LESKLLRYFVFGSVAALSQLVVLAALVEIAGMDKAVASVSSFYLAVIVNYCLQKRYTFNSSESDWTALPKFLAVSTLGACINIAIFVTLLEFLHYLVAQCVALLLVFMFNYSISRMFIFRKQRPAARESAER